MACAFRRTPWAVHARLSTRRLPPPRSVATRPPTRLSSTLAVPEGAWDSHMHVLESGYPLAADAVYKPHDAPLAAAQANAARLALPNLVFVQPSPYGLDNSCQLDAAAAHGLSRSRAVIVVDPAAATPAALRAAHARGARGVRVNLKSVGRAPTPAALAAELRRYAVLLRPLRTWCIQVYADLALAPQLADVVGELGVRLVVDHMGGPPAVRPDMHALPGWTSLLRMLERRDDVFVKLSAPYRFTPGTAREEFREFEPLARELLAARGGKGVVFASDWPHTRHEYTDPAPWVRRCLEWCGGDEQLRNDLFRDNARRLWDALD